MQNGDLKNQKKESTHLNEEMANKMSQKKEITTLDRNIVALMSYNIKLAEMIFELKENKKFDVYMGKDPLSVNIINNQTQAYLYESPAKEVEQKIIDFEEKYSRYQSLFLYGIGNGIFVKSILGNTSHSRIIVFEPELEILFIAFSLIDFSKDIYSERLIIFYPPIVRFIELYTVAKFNDVMLSSRLYDLHICNDFYEKNYEENIVEINKDIIRAIKQVILELGNDSRDTLIGIKHTTKNIPLVFENIPIKNLIEKRKKQAKTAIIVSTGPSLFKQLNLLKKVASYTTIICIDASYPILKKHGIKPHYVTTIERVELTSKFFKEPISSFDEGIIFLTASLTHEKTIENLKGREVCYVFRPLSYERGFDDNTFGYMGGGPSAAHMAFDLATYLEHEEVILIGQDLAFSQTGASHSKGHIFKSTEIKPNELNPEFAPKYGGDGNIETTTVWNLFRNYFEHIIAARNKDNKFLVYNCTQGGARIAGTVELPFSDMVKEILKQKSLKKLAPIKKLHPKFQTTHFKKARNHIQQIEKYGIKLQKRSEKLFLKVAKLIEKIKKLKQKNKENKIDYSKLQTLSFEIDTFKDSLNDKIFTSVFYGFCGIVLLHQEFEFASIMVKAVKTEQEKKDKLFEWVSVQGYWLFSLAGNVDIVLKEIKQSSKDWL